MGWLKCPAAGEGDMTGCGDCAGWLFIGLMCGPGEGSGEEEGICMGEVIPGRTGPGDVTEKD